MAEDNKSNTLPRKDRDPNRGNPTSFNRKAYKIEQLQYPSDLYSNQGVYGGNYVVFYINVADDARLLSNQLNKEVSSTVGDDLPPRLRGSLVGENYDAIDTILGAAVVGGVTGSALKSLESALRGTKDLKTFLRGMGRDTLIGAGISAAAAGAIVAAADAKMARQQKRIEKAIALHVPNQLNIRYSVDWQTEETLAATMGMSTARELQLAALSVAPLPSEESKLIGTTGQIAQNVVLSKTPIINAALSAQSGLSANPKKEQIFKNVNFREFVMDYTFSPRSAEESANVLNIIKQFKFHMHPEYKESGSFVFVYPSEFDIFYYHKDKENMNIHRHTSCVLKDMSINYTPNGNFNTFEGGMPTQINVQLSFVEIAFLTKKQIDDGF